MYDIYGYALDLGSTVILLCQYTDSFTAVNVYTLEMNPSGAQIGNVNFSEKQNVKKDKRLRDLKEDGVWK